MNDKKHARTVSLKLTGMNNAEYIYAKTAKADRINFKQLLCLKTQNDTQRPAKIEYTKSKKVLESFKVLKH